MNKSVCVFLWNNFMNDARVRRETEALIEAGYNVTVICTYDGDEMELFADEVGENYSVIRVWNFKTIQMILRPKSGIYSPLKVGVQILHKLKLDKIIDVIMVVWNMVKYGLKKKYDFYHANDLKTLPQGVLCSKLFRKAKLIYDAHEVETSRAGGKSKIKYIIERSLIRYTDKMLMTTQTRSEYTAKLYGINSPIVIHNYPVYRDLKRDEKNLYELLNIPKEEPILLYQGGLQEGRGLTNIIKAAPYFARGQVVFIGDGPMKKELMRMVKQAKLEHKVQFVNKVPAKDLLMYTQHAYLGFQVLENICFNHYSALSNKLLEYVMAEVPVICSDFPEMKKIVEEEEVGVCIESGNLQQLIDEVNALLQDTDRQKQYKYNCSKSKEIYNWSKEKHKFVRVYRELEVI